MFNRLSAAALAIGLGFSVSTAHAETTPIFTAPISATEASKSKRFAIDPELGRAWVEIEIYYATSEQSESYRVAVPGLSYNKDTAQVSYNAEGQTVVCANVRESGSWIFKHQRIESTGDCELTRKYVKVPVDDGFAVDVIEHFEVHFKPPVSRVGGVPASADKQD